MPGRVLFAILLGSLRLKKFNAKGRRGRREGSQRLNSYALNKHEGLLMKSSLCVFFAATLRFFAFKKK